jgi:hypothetical protein
VFVCGGLRTGSEFVLGCFDPLCPFSWAFLMGCLRLGWVYFLVSRLVVCGSVTSVLQTLGAAPYATQEEEAQMQKLSRDESQS